MKLLIVSDIHGSYKSAYKIKELSPSFDKIIILGDLLYHGPRNDLFSSYNPKQTIEILNSLSDKIIAIKGNCDAEVDQMVLNFDIMQENKRIKLDNHTAYIHHGHHSPKTDEKIILSGHTHIPLCKKENGIIYFNPGSITLPKENNVKSYGIYDNGRLSILNLDDKEFLSIELN